MFRNLSPGAIGISANLVESLELAKSAGFEGLDLPMGEAMQLAEEKGADYVKELYANAGLRMGGWGLPVDWRADEPKFQEQLKSLPKYAELAQKLGCFRVPTWVLPFSDHLPFKENFEWHVSRFRPIAEILKDYGCWLGLEFIGPATLRRGRKYEFIYTLPGMLELADAIGTGNVGLLLDSWHWYTSGGTIEQITSTPAEKVVYVHINDAPAGVPVDEQIDNVRCLPGETGVIDLKGFLQALKQIGYDGPVTPEPFSKRVNEMPAMEAAKTTGEALLKVWREAGV
jgi:sugar phosphate isomerase/epimerase